VSTTPLPDLGAIPTDVADLDPELLERLIATMHPGVGVSDLTVRRVWEWGQGEKVSTSGRVDLTVTYDDPGCGLPEQVVLKIARPQLPAFPLYRNEDAAYSHLRPWEFLRTPRCIGAWFDEASGSFGLALEDLTARGATFPSALTNLTVPQLESSLRQLAVLHARHWGEGVDWDGPGLAWTQRHTAGELHDLFNHPDLVPAMIRQEIELNQHKRELVQSVGENADSLFDKVAQVQQHQARLPQTLVHGDCHIGNHFALPDGELGLVDWQLSVRGHFMHDVSYAIVTGLDVETRRAHERRLVGLHLEEMARLDASGLPTLDEAFDEYRRAQAWNTYIGWLTCPVENYGWRINVANHIRLLVAYRDLDAGRAVAEVG
jgi:hypothetical protein